MSNMNEEKIVTMNETAETAANEPKKEKMFARLRNKVKNINWKKVGVYALNVAEGAALAGLGFVMGSKYGQKQAGLIPGEGTVEEADENDAEMDELQKIEEEA